MWNESYLIGRVHSDAQRTPKIRHEESHSWCSSPCYPFFTLDLG